MDSLRAYNHLESAILTGRLRPRERLVEKELAERLGMSRTPIREALRRLEERGMVRILPRRGAVVLVELIQQLRRQVHVVRFNAWAQPARIAPSIAGWWRPWRFATGMGWQS